MNPDLPPCADVKSLWQDTAVRRPNSSAFPADRHFDLAIIGGGFTGLSTARYAAEKGLSTVILEASRLGWGASGRNGGVVSGKFRASFRRMASRFGGHVARRMYDLGHESVDHLEQLVREPGMEASGYRNTGVLHCAHNSGSLESLRDEVEWTTSAFGGSRPRLLSRGEVERETGSGHFVGGLLEEYGGSLHPLNFLFGQAEALLTRGVSICEESPVMALRREPASTILQCPQGVVSAGQVVFATNAYSSLLPTTAVLSRTLIPFRSAIIATEKLPADIDAALLVESRSYTETRRMMKWFRKAEGRLIYGGRGAFGHADSGAAFDALEKAMRRQFPMLAETPVTHRWSGLVALTLDSVPHVGRIDDRVTYAVGYNGTGVAMSSYIGRHLAEIVTGGAPDLALMSAERLRSIPCYPLAKPAVKAVAGWYQVLDALGR